MSKKVRTYNKTTIELCRNCQGSGVVFIIAPFNTPSPCPICVGGGRVEKTLSITITINPYVGGL